MFQLPEGEVDYDVNLAYLIGRYIGDGWYDATNNTYGICSAFDEIQEMNDLFQRANVSFGQCKNHTVEQFFILKSKQNQQLFSCGNVVFVVVFFHPNPTTFFSDLIIFSLCVTTMIVFPCLFN